MLTLALYAALAGPAVHVSVEGDADDVVAFVRARLEAAGFALAEPGAADVRVRLRFVSTEVGRGIRVLVEDRRGALVDRVVVGDELQVASWLVVRDAAERIDVAASPPTRKAPPPPFPVTIDLLAGAAPDVTLSSSSFFPVQMLVSARFDVAGPLRVVADAGYCAQLQNGAVLHSAPIRAGVEAHGDVVDGVEWAAGARASTTPSLALAGKRAGGGLGAAVGAYGRALFNVGTFFGSQTAAVVEGGLESRLVRQAVLTDAGTFEEALFAAPISVGLEVRL